jgi:hypothetical protein
MQNPCHWQYERRLCEYFAEGGTYFTPVTVRREMSEIHFATTAACIAQSTVPVKKKVQSSLELQVPLLLLSGWYIPWVPAFSSRGAYAGAQRFKVVGKSGILLARFDFARVFFLQDWPIRDKDCDKDPIF